jgi:hypothetical protein
MDNSQNGASEGPRPHAESVSALRTFAISLRREADKSEAHARDLAVEVAGRIQAAKVKRQEADDHDKAADALEAGPYGKLVLAVDAGGSITGATRADIVRKIEAEAYSKAEIIR